MWRFSWRLEGEALTPSRPERVGTTSRFWRMDEFRKEAWPESGTWDFWRGRSAAKALAWSGVGLAGPGPGCSDEWRRVSVAEGGRRYQQNEISPVMTAILKRMMRATVLQCVCD